MPGEFRILTINPGSTSTKIGVYANERAEWVSCLRHTEDELEPCRGRPVLEQLEFRRIRIETELRSAGFELSRFDAVAGRGGLMRPIPSGTYRVNEEMLSDLRLAPYGEHASNLGAFLAEDIARCAQAPAFVVGPVSVDEFTDMARISGTALAERHSLSHALNTKAVAKRYAREHEKAYAELRLVIAPGKRHLGLCA